MTLLALYGYAGCGKDTLHQLCAELAPGHVGRLALGDLIKREVDAECRARFGISAFTEERREKAVIRPFLEEAGMRLRDGLQGQLLEEARRLPPGRLTFITRVQDVTEMRRWMGVGARPLLVAREGHPPATDTERRQVQEIATSCRGLLIEAGDLTELRVAARCLVGRFLC